MPQMAKNGKNRLAILTIFRFRRTEIKLRSKPSKGCKNTKWLSNFVFLQPLNYRHISLHWYNET
jgi:hypothetical protein